MLGGSAPHYPSFFFLWGGHFREQKYPERDVHCLRAAEWAHIQNDIFTAIRLTVVPDSGGPSWGPI